MDSTPGSTSMTVEDELAAIKEELAVTKRKHENEIAAYTAHLEEQYAQVDNTLEQQSRNDNHKVANAKLKRERKRDHATFAIQLNDAEQRAKELLDKNKIANQTGRVAQATIKELTRMLKNAQNENYTEAHIEALKHQLEIQTKRTAQCAKENLHLATIIDQQVTKLKELNAIAERWKANFVETKNNVSDLEDEASTYKQTIDTQKEKLTNARSECAKREIVHENNMIRLWKAFTTQEKIAKKCWEADNQNRARNHEAAASDDGIDSIDSDYDEEEVTEVAATNPPENFHDMTNLNTTWAPTREWGTPNPSTPDWIKKREVMKNKKR